jgi:hypothetical protein
MKKILGAFIIVSQVLLFSCSSKNNQSEITLNQNDSLKINLELYNELIKKTGRNTYLDYLTKERFDNEIKELKYKISNLKEENERELQFLKSINEPNISSGKLDYECFRIRKTAGWGISNFIIRIEHKNGKSNITFKEFGYNKLGNDSVFNNFTKSISIDEWQKFSRLMTKEYFWGLKTENLYQGLDSDTWIFEGAVHQPYAHKKYFSMYHKFTFWGNPDNMFLDESLYYLFQLTGLDKKKFYRLYK